MWLVYQCSLFLFLCFLETVHVRLCGWEFIACSARLCKAGLQLSVWWFWGGHRSDVIHQMEKADFSGVRFHGHPAPAVISAPQGPISTRADGRPWFPSARLNLALVPRGLKSIWDVWRKKKLENSRLHIVATLFRALGKVRHLDDVWNFTWKICGEKLKRGLSLDRQQQRLHDP